jgi:UDP-N-acetylmuramate dehydrogenase
MQRRPPRGLRYTLRLRTWAVYHDPAFRMETMLSTLAAIAGLTVRENAPLGEYTRFGLGGPARLLIDASTEDALIQAVEASRTAAIPLALIGGGSNLVAPDEGFAGMVLRYTAAKLPNEPTGEVDAGAILQNLVDKTIGMGLGGLETMTGIPGWVGGAIYGNAGAYGRSIHELVESVRFFDGRVVREIGNAECQFRYRESVFKRHKDWVILSARLRLCPADPAELRATASGILKIRNEKYPPEMRCAGSIFKNLILAGLPPSVRAQVPERVVRDGKVPSAYFLEQAGAKGMALGGIQVARYHANLLYNTGTGTAAELRDLIEILKIRVWEKFGLELEEEVQYL